jgi:hypothetical protein
MNAITKQATKALTDAALKRDPNGYGAVPSFENFPLPEQDLAPLAVINGYEVHVVKMMDDTTADTAILSAWVSGDGNISAWQPPAPEGDNWRLVIVADHEEGPFAVFVRPGVHGVADGKAFAQEFLLGSMIKACTKHMKPCRSRGST